MSHLDEEQLFLLTLGQLEGEAQREAQAHLEGCPECRHRHQHLSSAVFARTVPGSSGSRVQGVPTRPEGQPSGDRPAKGTSLGRYVVLEQLGAGGMGEVFAAYDPHLDRRVALKLLKASALSAEEGKARLLREAQAMARLQHPNVIAVHDVGTLEDRVFVAMEFVDGETISDWLRGDRTWQQVLDLFIHAGQGLAAAHRAGLVHRDFKPDNVLVGTADGRPRVLDFGLARQAGTSGPPRPAAGPDDTPLGPALETPLTRDGAVMGTPGYMAPEQLAGLPTDARSDQFSFCVALHEALYGRRPFAGATLRQLGEDMARGQVPPPPPGSQVPAWVHPVLARGLAADPAARYPDMDHLLRALQPARRRGRRTRLALAGLLVAAVAGGGWTAWSRQRLAVCAGQELRLQGVWDAAVRARLEAAFAAAAPRLGAEAWRAVEKALDGWALDWVATAREACEAARVRRTDSEELRQLKAACLEDRRQQLESLVSLFAQADAEVVTSAPGAARSLESALACGSRRRRPAAPDAGDLKAEVALRSATAAAQALFAAGKYDEAGRRLRPALQAAAPARGLAEAWLLLGRVETLRRDIPAAQRALLAAADQALLSGDEALLAVALSRLSALAGYDEAQGSAEVLGHLAVAAASRAPGEWEVQVELARNEALVELKKGQLAAARADLERALALQREHLPAEHPEVAATLNNLGMVLTRLNLLDEAIASYRQSLAIHEAVEGPRHPGTATSAQNLGIALRLVGRHGEARALLERALQVRREALGPAHPDTVHTQLSLVRACVAQGALDEAAALLKSVPAVPEGPGAAQARWWRLGPAGELALASGDWRRALAVGQAQLEVARQLKAGDSVQAARALQLQGEALTGLGQWAEAARALDQAQRMTAHGDPRDRAEVEEALGHLELAQGRPAQAAPHFQAALALRDGVGLTSPEQAEALLDLAGCKVDQGDGPGALALAEKAAGLFARMQVRGGPERAAFAAAQARWLQPGDRTAAAKALQAALAALPPEHRPGALRWLQAHGVR